MSGDVHGRIDQVENEMKVIGTDVAGLKSDMSGLKADMRGFGTILQRIDDGVKDAMNRVETDKAAARLNPTAVASVLMTLISIIVGGAWLVSGQIARLDERDLRRDIEVIEMNKRIDRVDVRQWQDVKGGTNEGTKGPTP